MKIRMISIPQEIDLKLREEDNASLLIRSLLEEYYQNLKVPQEKKDLITQLEDSTAETKKRMETDKLRNAIMGEIENGKDRES